MPSAIPQTCRKPSDSRGAIQENSVRKDGIVNRKTDATPAGNRWF